MHEPETVIALHQPLGTHIKCHFRLSRHVGRGVNSKYTNRKGLQGNQKCRVIYKWLHRQFQVQMDHTDYGLFYKPVHLYG